MFTIFNYFMGPFYIQCFRYSEGGEENEFARVRHIRYKIQMEDIRWNIRYRSNYIPNYIIKSSCIGYKFTILYSILLSLLEDSDSFKQPYLDKQNHLEGLAPGHTF